MPILDGKRLAEVIQEKVRLEIETFRRQGFRAPGLRVIMIGDHPASRSYVSGKEKSATKIGIDSRVISLGAEVAPAGVLDLVKTLNGEEAVDAILVQLPLPSHLDPWEIIGHLEVEKDVDCFHPCNQGLVLLNRSKLFPCTPAGIIRLLDEYDIALEGLNAAVVGRSFIVGKPMALMLSNRNATVTLCHSKTRELPLILSRADLIVAAIGKAGWISADMVKDQAVLIDVGINRIASREEIDRLGGEALVSGFKKKGYALVGDIHPEAYRKASFYTPVPGGVGPMTVAMLMHNTLELYKRRMKKAKI